MDSTTIFRKIKDRIAEATLSGMGEQINWKSSELCCFVLLNVVEKLIAVVAVDF